MAKVMTEAICVREATVSSSASPHGVRYKSSRIRASQPRNHKNFFKQLGMFSRRKEIEDSIISAEIWAPSALEQAELKRTKQLEVVHECNLWDDLQADEILFKLGESDKLVDSLKDLSFKAEEAKLIMELVEMDAINDGLFKQAYTASVDVSLFLKRYEMTKYLKEPYDKEGACITIESGDGGINNERWAEQLVQMYIRWAEKQGHMWRIVEKLPSKGVGVRSATLEFESKFVYGYLMGERGIHRMIRGLQDGPTSFEATLASVDVIPLFLESAPDVLINEKDLVISSLFHGEDDLYRKGPSVHIQHIPTGLTVKATGERSLFANKMKALNRLKAKLLTILKNQRISSVEDINKGAILDSWSEETRRYVFHPTKLVDDVKTGVQLSDLTSVLNGHIEPLLAAHIRKRSSSDGI